MRLHPLYVLMTVALMLFAVSSAPVSAAETPPPAPLAAIELAKEAWKLYSQHHYAEAEVPAKRSLELMEAALPPDDVPLLVARENLAMIYQGEQRDVDAARLYEQALPIWEKVLGTNNPAFAARLSKVGMLYQNLGLL